MRFRFQILSIVLLLSSLLVMSEELNYFMPPKREMRAVWIATVTNLDWPSQKGLSVEKQQKEMIQLLDSFKSCNINTVIFQARPSADAFYESDLEPWSMWLMGQQGEAPSPLYDPLQFVIDEAHKRCMEVHVWINPYRALSYDNTSKFAKSNIYWKHKDWFVKYDGKYYFDPGKKDVCDYLLSVVGDVVRRYDIDAIHFDDYFYPYPVPKEKFNDDQTFKDDSRGFKRKADWRRDNVTRTITLLRDTIKSIKSWVQFGISPFGVWRHYRDDSCGSKTWKALSNYDDLYADVYKWMKDSLLDYVVPQLYWEIGKKNTDYKVLINWWSQNCFSANLYIGQYASGLVKPLNDAPAWRKPNELVRQLILNRKTTNTIGTIFFSASSFVRNRQGLLDSLKSNYYTYPALTPISQLTQGKPSKQPSGVKVKKEDDKIELTWNAVKGNNDGMEAFYYVVYMFKGKKSGDTEDVRNIVTTTRNNSLDVSSLCNGRKGKYCFVVTSVNRYRQESKVTKVAVVKL